METHLDKPPEDWEIYQIGPDVVDRTTRIVETIKNNQSDKERGKPIIKPDVLYSHSIYMHDLGKQLLKMQPSNSSKYIDSKLGMSSKSIVAGGKKRRAPRGRISVDDVERSEKLIAIDLEWDTSSWSNEEIEAGCETLVQVFQNQQSTDAYQDQAIKMLEKLMRRHEVAVVFMRRNIEMLLGKAVTRRLRSSISGGILPLLKVLNLVTPQFIKEFSIFNMVGRIIEVVLLEAKLAATLIQHTFRSYSTRPGSQDIGRFDDGFATTAEIQRQMQRATNARSAELRRQWRLMHPEHLLTISPGVRQGRPLAKLPSTKIYTHYGLRGPVYIGEKYLQLMLSIVSCLVSEPAAIHASGNREDAIRSGGLILFAGFVSVVTGPFTLPTVRILSKLSKHPRALYPMIRSGCVKALLKFFRAMRANSEKNLNELIEVVASFAHLAEHAAGLFRGRGRYDTVTPATADTEEADYLAVLAELEAGETPVEVQRCLGGQAVVKELIQVLEDSLQAPLVSKVLQTLFRLSCSECFENVLTELLALGSRGLWRVVQLLEEQDTSVSMPAMFLLLQLSTREDCRGGFITSRLPHMLQKTLLISSNFNLPSYRRGMLVLIALCRRGNWRSYNPLTLPRLIANREDILDAVYLDAMTTLKEPNPDDKVAVAQRSLVRMGNLLLLPTIDSAAQYLSSAAYKVGAATISEFLCRPSDPRHFHSMSWESAASGCVIIEALVQDAASARQILSTASVRYLGHCVYFSFLEISEKRLSETRTTQLLHATVSSLTALSRMCEVCTGTAEEAEEVKDGCAQAHVVLAADFFALTMATKHPSLACHPQLKSLQEQVALAALLFLRDLATVDLRSGDLKGLAEMAGLLGKDMCELLGSLRTTHGMTEHMMAILDRVCQLVAILIRPSQGLDAALHSWRLFHALRIHLPPPLSHLAGLSPREPTPTSSQSESDALTTPLPTNYLQTATIAGVATAQSGSVRVRNPLRSLPASYFEVLANLSINQMSKALILGEGYLRRTLEKMSLCISEQRQGAVEGGKYSLEDALKVLTEPRHSKPKQELRACLQIITNMANFTSPKLGTANDLILQSDYNTTRICVVIISSDDFNRSDELVVQSLLALRAIAKDCVRVSAVFDELGIVDVILKEMNSADGLYSEETAKTILDIILDLSRGLTGTATSRSLYRLRESVFRLSRSFPVLYSHVNDTLWAMSRHFAPSEDDALGLHPSGLDSSKMSDWEEDQKALLRLHSRNHSRSTSHLLLENSVNMDDDNITSSSAPPGTYAKCGISNCGGLGNTQFGSYNPMKQSSTSTGNGLSLRDEYNLTQSPVKKERDPAKLAKIKISDGGWACDVSGEIANKASLRNSIQRRKFLYGFSETLPVTKTKLKPASSAPEKTAKAKGFDYDLSTQTRGYRPSRDEVVMRTVSTKELPEIIMTRPPPR